MAFRGFEAAKKILFEDVVFVTLFCHIKKKWGDLGRGGGPVVRVLTFYTDDPSSIPAEA